MAFSRELYMLTGVVICLQRNRPLCSCATLRGHSQAAPSPPPRPPLPPPPRQHSRKLLPPPPCNALLVRTLLLLPQIDVLCSPSLVVKGPLCLNVLFNAALFRPNSKPQGKIQISLHCGMLNVLHAESMC